MIHTLFITLAIYAVVAFFALLIRKHTAQWSEMDYDEPDRIQDEEGDPRVPNN